jgi:hypothetical protein
MQRGVWVVQLFCLINTHGVKLKIAKQHPREALRTIVVFVLMTTKEAVNNSLSDHYVFLVY